MSEKDQKNHLKEKQEIRRGIKAIWRHTKPFRKSLLVLTIFGLISAIANGFVPYITGRFFDALVSLSQGKTELGTSDIPLWTLFLAAWTAAVLVANNIDWVMERLRRDVANIAYFNIQAEAFSHFLKLPLQYHKNVHINGETQKISSASWRLSSTIRTLTDLAPQFLSILIGITLAASINTTIAIVLLLGVLLYIVLLIKILLPIAAIDREAHKAMNNSWDDAAAAVQQIESVKQASSEEYEEKKIWNNFRKKSFELWGKVERSWTNVSFYQRTIVFLTQFSVFIISVNFISKGIISVGELVALNGYALMFFGPFVSLGYAWQYIQNGITTAAQAEDIFDTSEEEYIPKNAVDAKDIKGEVVFENVSFKYAPDQPVVLENVSFKANPGETIAVVGESGVGKSTAISLISGYYFPTSGKVMVDGVETNKYKLKQLRRQIAVVPQEVALFNDTIEANIKYGSFNASNEDVKRVAREAHIDAFIEDLPEGYNTLVGERGIKLSVGQKQRVSIARAMLRDPAILILDEPTSALDAKTEKVITEALEELMRGRTTFVIAHRLSTVRKADKILVFDKGKIVESGTHEELIHKENGIYRRLYEYQVGLH